MSDLGTIIGAGMIPMGKHKGSSYPGLAVPAVLEALRGRSRLMRQWRAFLSDYPVMLCPVSGELPFDDLRDVISQSEFETIITAQALQIGLPFLGLPGLSVATGTAQGRPVGVQLVANQFREDILLDAGDNIAGIVPTTL